MEIEIIKERGGDLVELKDKDLAYDIKAIGIQRVITDEKGEKVLGELHWLEEGEKVKFNYAETILINTGIKINFPEPIEIREKGKVIGKKLLGAFVRGRSGQNLKGGFLVKTGTIDNDYQGYIGVVLTNLINGANYIEYGDRIGQLQIVESVKFNKDIFKEVKEFSLKSIRGETGFGNTGLK